MRLTVCLALVVSLIGCTAVPASTPTADGRPLNVIVIMADDSGAECYTPYGGTGYSTPNIAEMAERGMLFTAAHSQPICTPTRVKLMTGMSNGRNYIRFGMLDAQAYTFGNLMQDHGYATGLVGKWQLWGRADEPFAHEGLHPTQAGFDEYLCWHLDRRQSRYWNPVLDLNGEYLDTTEEDYGPTIFADFAIDFIDRHQDEPFFLYYPMVLPHDPFPVTPLSEDRNSRDGQANFGDMVAYVDHNIGRINEALAERGLADNTLVIFTADNGSPRQITSHIGELAIAGGKGHAHQYGTHVPMVVACEGLIEPGGVNNDLIDFADFFATIAEVTGADVPEGISLDGVSFLPQLRGEAGSPHDYLYCYYNARPTNPGWWGLGVQRFVHDGDYKLYARGEFYNMQADPLEESPIAEADMTAEQRAIRERFQQVLDESPSDPPRLAQPRQRD